MIVYRKFNDVATHMMQVTRPSKWYIRCWCMNEYQAGGDKDYFLEDSWDIMKPCTFDEAHLAAQVGINRLLREGSELWNSNNFTEIAYEIHLIRSVGGKKKRRKGSR